MGKPKLDNVSQIITRVNDESKAGFQSVSSQISHATDQLGRLASRAFHPSLPVSSH